MTLLGSSRFKGSMSAGVNLAEGVWIQRGETRPAATSAMKRLLKLKAKSRSISMVSTLAEVGEQSLGQKRRTRPSFQDMVAYSLARLH